MDGEPNQPADNNVPENQDGGAPQQPAEQQPPAEVPVEQQQMDMDEMMGGGAPQQIQPEMPNQYGIDPNQQIN